MEPEEKKERKKYKRRNGERPGGYVGGLLAILLIIGIFFGIKYFSGDAGKVAGVNTDTKKEQETLQVEKQKAKENVKNQLNDRLEKIKSDIDDLSIVDVTSQSPQVQKIVRDLQALQNLPKDQVKKSCEQICQSFE